VGYLSLEFDSSGNRSVLGGKDHPKRKLALARLSVVLS